MISPEFVFDLLSAAGITNIIALVLIFFSCRCLAGRRIFTFLNQFGWYGKFYRAHCIFWWIFLVSVLVHIFSAWYLFGIPFTR